MNKSFAALYMLLSISGAVAFGAWIASSWIKSPAEVAARTAAPRPSPILVPIEKRVLRSKIITRGTARFGLPQQVSLPPSSLKMRVGLITTLPLPNTVVKEGDILLTASGRPVFVLKGRLTGYRDLTPGIIGSDVRQLEQALERLGYEPGPVDDIFDRRTSAAVKAWYEASGLEPFGPTPDQLRTVQVLEKQWNDARRLRVSAIAAEATSILGMENARAKAERDRKAAEADLEAKSVALKRLKARLNFNKKGIGSNGKGSAGLDINSTELPSMKSAKAVAERNNMAAAADLADKKAALQRLRDAKRTALRTVEVAKQVASHNNKVAQAAVKEVTSKGKYIVEGVARAKIEQAHSAAAKVRIEGELAVLRAQREIESLDDKIELTERQVKLSEAAVKSILLEGERAIQRAAVESSVSEGELQASIKQVALAEAAITATSLDGQLAIQSAVDRAEIAKLEAKLAKQKEKRAKQELDQARKKIGIQVPVDEYIFLPELPVRVHEVKASIGDEAKGYVLSVTDNKLSIDSSLTLDMAQLVKVGMEVLIDEQAVGARAKGTISYVADTPGTRGVDAYHRYLKVDVLETNMPIQKYSLRLIIPIESTVGEKIVVPVTSLSLASDGTSQLQIQKNGMLEAITVKPGLSADGYVEVTPVNGELQVGQLVVVGFENPKN